MVDPPEAGELKLGSWSELGVIISFANASSRERASYVCRSWLAVHDFAYVISFSPGCTSVHHLVLTSPQHPTFAPCP